MADEITSGHSAKVLAWLEARGVGDAVARYAMDEASRCDLGAECPDGCGALEDYTVTFDVGAGTWTARSNSGRPTPGTWTVFASSGVHSRAAADAVLAIELHTAERPGDFVHAVISDAYPASVIIANLTAGQCPTCGGRQPTAESCHDRLRQLWVPPEPVSHLSRY